MALDPGRLWAKGKRHEDPIRPSMYLLHHLQDVHESDVTFAPRNGAR